jgi:hypothetical protein
MLEESHVFGAASVVWPRYPRAAGPKISRPPRARGATFVECAGAQQLWLGATNL